MIRFVFPHKLCITKKLKIMAKYKVVYSRLYEKYVVKQNTAVGWVSLEEFMSKDDAIACMNRLRGKSA